MIKLFGKNPVWGRRKVPKLNLRDSNRNNAASAIKPAATAILVRFMVVLSTSRPASSLGDFRYPRHFRPFALFFSEKFRKFAGPQVFDQRLRFLNMGDGFGIL
jgi:hypothetical protein